MAATLSSRHDVPSVGGLSRRTLLGGGLAAAAIATTGTPARAQGSTERPWTIPALQTWTARTGTFILGASVRVLVRPDQAHLLDNEATLLTGDLTTETGSPAGVDVTGRRASAGEIELRIGVPDPALGEEGYELTVGSSVTVSANTATGVYYGTRSLLQMLRQGTQLPAGTGRDWPRYAERGLMLDIGRKHLAYDWIVARVREMAWLKLNYLHLHFTEDLGWRIESDQVPRVHSDDDFLTKAQIRSLIELCSRHHITVVPEVDVPGHMGAALRNRPELQLRNLFGVAEPTKLDYTLPAARAFARSLVEEYVELFPGPWFHLGFDEFVPELQQLLYPQLARFARQSYGSTANARDGAIGFANELIGLLRDHGKSARVAHDGTFGGTTQRLDTSAVVEWWTDFSPLAIGSTSLPSPRQIVAAGNRVMNIGWYPTYYSNLPIYYPVPRADLQGFYEDWRVHRFRGVLVVRGALGTPYHDIAPGEPLNQGSRLSVWFDDPDRETPEQVAAGIHPRLRIMAQQTWESPQLVATHAGFSTVIDRVGNAPGG